MASIFNARFDLNSYSAVNADTFSIVGNVVDNTGVFSVYDIQAGDIVYNDASLLALGVLRYKVLTVDAINASQATLTVKWDLANEAVVEPILAAAGCIGRPNSQGVILIPDALQQNLDVAFTNSVRNCESLLLSQKIGSIGELPADVMLKSVYDKDADQKIDDTSMPVIDPGAF